MLVQQGKMTGLLLFLLLASEACEEYLEAVEAGEILAENINAPLHLVDS